MEPDGPLEGTGREGCSTRRNERLPVLAHAIKNRPLFGCGWLICSCLRKTAKSEPVFRPTHLRKTRSSPVHPVQTGRLAAEPSGSDPALSAHKSTSRYSCRNMLTTADCQWLFSSRTNRTASSTSRVGNFAQAAGPAMTAVVVARTRLKTLNPVGFMIAPYSGHFYKSRFHLNCCVA